MAQTLSWEQQLREQFPNSWTQDIAKSQVLYGVQAVPSDSGSEDDETTTTTTTTGLASLPTVSDGGAAEVPVPIMARLPLDGREHEDDDDDAYSYWSRDELSYLQTSTDTFPGILDDAALAQTVLYTRSRLPRIDAASKALWEALHRLRPLSTDYALKAVPATTQIPHPISETSDLTQCPFSMSATTPSPALDLVRRLFNWNDIARALPESLSGEWMGVIFHSKRAAGSESIQLYAADRLAHEEAVTSGGLLMYWYGTPDPVTGINLATCIWTDRADAVTASALPLHKEAVRHAMRAYESFDLNRYRLKKVVGSKSLIVLPWT